MSKSSIEYLYHIVDECDFLIAVSSGVDFDSFLQDGTLKRAFVRSIEIIGEATKLLPVELREKYSYLDWRAMAGMRDRLIHGYFGIDYEIGWNVVTSKIPELRQQIQAIIHQEA
jgi:uncharacterized protein with HEPN domain